MSIQFKKYKAFILAYVFIFTMLVSIGHSLAATQEWTHPLGLPYGDMTYDEWAKWKNEIVHDDTRLILAQLKKHYTTDQWAGYIAHEILYRQSNFTFDADSEEALTSSANLGNTLSLAMLGYIKKSSESESRLKKASYSGHPRALVYLALTKNPQSAEQLMLLKEAANKSDEMALFLLAFHDSMKENNSWGEKARDLLRQAANTPGLLSANPLRRELRNGNDAPGSFFYYAQSLLIDQEEISSYAEIEKYLLEATTRISPQDQRRYMMFGENTAARAHTLLGTEIYRSTPLKDTYKMEHHLSMASAMGDPFGSHYYARYIYHPKKGIKPDNIKYIETLKLASDQGGVMEHIDLAKEYIKGIYVTRDIEYAINLMKPFDSEYHPEAKLIIAEALISGSPEQAEEGVRVLESIWNSSKEPKAAELLANYFSANYTDSNSPAFSSEWFEKSFQAYLAKSREEAALLAFVAAQKSFERGGFQEFTKWKKRVISTSSDPKDKEWVEALDALLVMVYGTKSEGEEKIPALKELFEKGNALAGFTLGALAYETDNEIRHKYQIHNYEMYFDKILAQDGNISATPIIQYILQAAKSNEQQTLKKWLEKTKNFHGPDESAILAHLNYISSRPGSTERLTAIQSLYDSAANGSGYAAGLIAVQRENSVEDFTDLDLDTVTLLTYSVTSSFPYPDSFAFLGKRYLTGDEVEQDIQTAQLLLKKGAESGSGKSMLYIAKALFDGDFTVRDIETALQYSRLAEAYGVRDAKILSDEILTFRDKNGSEQENILTAGQSVEFISPDQTSEPHQQYSPQPPPQTPSRTSGFFRGLGSFLMTALEIGIVVGIVVLAASAGVDASPAFSSSDFHQPSTYKTPTSVYSTSIYDNPSRQSYRSAGMPSYSQNQTTYYSNPLSRISSAPSNNIVSPYSNISLPNTVSFRERFNYNPAEKLRGYINSDGTFTARSLNGAAIQGSLTTSPTGQTQLKVRPKHDHNPSHQYSGQLDSYGNVKLKNPYTGKTISGNYEWASNYDLK